MKTLKPAALKTLIGDLFERAGCGAEEAAVISDHLVEANLVGHDSHGVIRAPIYLQWMSQEKVFAGRSIEVVVDSGPLAVADAGLGYGQWTGRQAVAVGVQKCREHGVAIVALRNAAHLGRIGTWAEIAAAEGLVSLHFVNTTGLGMFVVPTGGRDARLSVNPVCIGIPIEGRDAIILDIAAAASAEGKLKVARNKGVPVPDNTIVDAEGNATNDANDFYGPEGGRPVGAILPFGGHKGYGLGLVAEILAGALTGGGCSVPGKTLLEQGMLSIYVDPAKLQTPGSLFEEIRRYVDFVKTSRPTTPDGEVLVPGEIENRNRAVRSKGLELDDTTWGQIVDAAKSVGVEDDLIEDAVLS
ncbi:MAG: Ldh family oxidoreductase [Planctomycetota bacterium]|nr:Ldh family oxidoreductase [Planctomycetota bacterium]MDA1250525.1 Ldh family oxidoreductase [Planctomycetota bacterium]